MNKTPLEIQSTREKQFKKHAEISNATYTTLLNNAGQHQTGAKIYYPTGLFSSNESQANDDHTEGSLHRTITKNMAIDTAGNQNTLSQGATLYNRPYFNAAVSPATPEFAIAKTPKEILKSGFTVRASQVHVFATGGYGSQNPRKVLQPTEQFDVIMASVAGIALDNAFTDQMLIGIDPIRNATAQVVVLSNDFAIRLPSYQEARASLDQSSAQSSSSDNIIQNEDYAYIQGMPTGRGSPYLTRSTDGYSKAYDTAGNAPSNAVIFNKKLYRDILAKRIELALHAICDQAGPNANPIFLKAVLLGGGFFSAYGWGNLPDLTCYPAVADGISSYSYLINQMILDGWKQGLELFCKNQPTLAKRIGMVEFPLFSHESQVAYRNTWQIPEDQELDEAIKLNGINITQKKRDVLIFTDEEKQNYTCATVNPADANGEPANELDYTQSVEAELGANTTLPLVQSHIFNANLTTQTEEVDLSVAEIGIQPAAHFFNDEEDEEGQAVPTQLRFSDSRRGKLFNGFGFVLGGATLLGGITAIISIIIFLFAPNLAKSLNFLPHTELLTTGLVAPLILAIGVMILTALALGLVLFALNSRKNISSSTTDSTQDVNSNTQPNALDSGFANFCAKIGIFIGFPLGITLVAISISMGLFQLGIKPFMPMLEPLSGLGVNSSVLLSLIVIAAVTFVVALVAILITNYFVRKEAQFEFDAAKALRGEGIMFPLQDLASVAPNSNLQLLHDDSDDSSDTTYDVLQTTSPTDNFGNPFSPAPAAPTAGTTEQTPLLPPNTNHQ